MNYNFTSGPWVLDIGNGKIQRPNGYHIATMRPTCVNAGWEADARLIALAPELVEALRELLHQHVELIESEGWDVETEKSVIAARTLLARVEAK